MSFKKINDYILLIIYFDMNGTCFFRSQMTYDPNFLYKLNIIYLIKSQEKYYSDLSFRWYSLYCIFIQHKQSKMVYCKLKYMLQRTFYLVFFLKCTSSHALRDIEFRSNNVLIHSWLLVLLVLGSLCKKKFRLMDIYDLFISKKKNTIRWVDS